MLIDWFTVGAQVLNFLLLVWLLKRFLYKPILHAIDDREKKIAAELADADARKAEAREEQNEFQQKNKEFDRQREALLQNAVAEVKTERQRLMDEARQGADALSAKRQEALKSDAINLNQAIRRRTQQQVFAISRQALFDLAGASLEDRMSEVFIRRLQEMSVDTKESLNQVFKSAPGAATLRSTFDLSEAQRAKIQEALGDIFATEIVLKYETAPNLVSGIELSANGHRVAWSIANYLTALENGVSELLKDKNKTASERNLVPGSGPSSKKGQTPGKADTHAN